MFHIAQSTRKRSTLLIGPFGISLLLENLTPRTHVRDVEGCDDVYFRIAIACCSLVDVCTLLQILSELAGRKLEGLL